LSCAKFLELSDGEQRRAKVGHVIGRFRAVNHFCRNEY